MTNEQIEQKLSEISDLLADVAKEVASLVRSKTVSPEFRSQQSADAESLLARVDALRQVE